MIRPVRTLLVANRGEIAIRVMRAAGLAMKMEAAVRADRDGEIIEVLARPGQQVDAKDLLVVLA